MSRPRSDFLGPLWRRVVLVALCAGWAALEFANGQAVWATLAGAATLYGVYSLLIAYEPPGNDGRQ